MKRYFVLTVFSYDTLIYAFDSLNLLFNFIKYRCDCEDSFYIENKFLSSEMMKTLHIDYITK
ncbi:MAG: hypothetical protein ACI4VL_02920 [Bacilli bacterium]